MAFINSGGFIFSGGGGKMSAMLDGYYNPCVRQTQGLSDRQQVTVRVRQGIGQEVAQPEQTIVVTIEQVTVTVPSQQNIQNPVRTHQNELLEIPVAHISTTGNQALVDFNQGNIVEEPGMTFLLPLAARPERIAQQAMQPLAKEIAAQAATSVDLADDAARAASSTVDDAARLAAKLKSVAPAQIQQVLQKAGLSFDKARQIANAVSTNIDDAAALLRQQGFSQVANINRQVVSQINRVIASVC